MPRTPASTRPTRRATACSTPRRWPGLRAARGFFAPSVLATAKTSGSAYSPRSAAPATKARSRSSTRIRCSRSMRVFAGASRFSARSCRQSRSPRSNRALALFVVGVPCVAECDAIAHHRGTAEQPRALHRILTEAITDLVHRDLEPVAPRPDRCREQVQLAVIHIGQSRQADTQRSDRAANVAPRQHGVGGLVELLACRE